MCSSANYDQNHIRDEDSRVVCCNHRESSRVRARTRAYTHVCRQVSEEELRSQGVLTADKHSRDSV